MVSRVTVGICAHNEGNNIGTLLKNVLNDQDLSVDSEVLIVCSGCTDDTVETVQKYSLKDCRVKVHIENERKGKASAINYILAKASSDVIFFISADTIPRKHILLKLMSKLDASKVGVVCGNPVPVNGSNSLVGRIVQMMWNFHAYVFEELNDAGLARHATEAFCIRKGIVKQIPFETVNDDAYLAIAAVKKGWLVKFSAESEVFICGPKTFQEYAAQRRRVVFGHYQLRKLTGESPQYLVHLMLVHPVRASRLALRLFSKYDAITVTSFLFTEFMVNVAAMIDFVSGKKHGQWQVLPSTKTVAV